MIAAVLLLAGQAQAPLEVTATVVRTVATPAGPVTTDSPNPIRVRSFEKGRYRIVEINF